MSWKKYDTQYRLHKEQNPASFWGEVDSELWLMYMTPGSTHNASMLTSPKPNIGKCYNFNFKGSCDKFPCMYKHSCLRCGSLHLMLCCTMTIPHSVFPQTFHSFSAHNQSQPSPRSQTNTTNGYPYNPRQPSDHDSTTPNLWHLGSTPINVSVLCP